MKSKFTDLEKQEIVAQYWNGQPVHSLCTQYGVPRSTLYSWLKPYKKFETFDPTTRSDITQKEYAELKRRADKQSQILEVIRISGCLPTAPLEEKLVAFETLQGQYSACVLCEALNIARGTYHKRIVKQNNPTVYAQRRKEISEQVRAVFEESDQRYGADKIVAVLAERGIRTSKKYVLKLMREMGLQSIGVHSKRDYRKFARKKNVVQRQFHAEAPNMIWVSDVTCFRVKNDYFYICVILDLFSRKVVAHCVSRRNSTQLITRTFKTAFEGRGCPSSLTFHSDRGSQYTSTAFRKRLLSNQVAQSFSGPGRPVDNAVAESFFALLKREELYRRNYRSEREFRESVTSYMRFYNMDRPHSANRYKTPEQVEIEYHQSP